MPAQKGFRTDQVQCVAPSSTSKWIDVEHVAQALHPTHRCAPPLRHGLLVVAGRRGGPWRRHDEAAVARVGGEQAVEADEMASRARHQSGPARDEVRRLEQHVGGSIAKGGLQLIAHRA